MENLKNDYVELIKESYMPVEYIKSIDETGNFVIETPKYGDNHCNYYGRIINNGVLAIIDFNFNCPSEFDGLLETSVQILIGHNIGGYNFKANVYCDINKNFENNIKYTSNEKNNKNKILLLYENYESIIKALNENIDDEYIQKLFGLDYFESNLVDTKIKIANK